MDNTPNPALTAEQDEVAAAQKDAEEFNIYRELLTRTRNGYTATKDERAFLRDFYRKHKGKIDG